MAATGGDDFDNNLDDLLLNTDAAGNAGQVSMGKDDPDIRSTSKVAAPEANKANEVISSKAVRSNKVTTPIVRPASNKVTRRLRRSDSKDRQIIDGIRNFVVARHPGGTLALVGDFHTSILTSSWEHTKDRVKLAFANEALELHSDKESRARPVSWSLNLGPERLTEALSHPRGFVGCLSGLINRALASRLGFVPSYWFLVDIEKDRLHLHGGILASPHQVPTIEEAMRHAGGKWSAGPRSGDKHQFHCNQDRCDYGWITYALERKSEVKRLIGRHSFFIGKNLRREAGALYGHYRKILRGEADDV